MSLIQILRNKRFQQYCLGSVELGISYTRWIMFFPLNAISYTLHGIYGYRVTRFMGLKGWFRYPWRWSPQIIEINELYSNEDMKKIKQGFLPSEMEQKYFIFYEFGRLHFVRSWTGFHHGIAYFKKMNDGYMLTHVKCHPFVQHWRNGKGEYAFTIYGIQDPKTMKTIISCALLKKSNNSAKD